MVIPKETQFIPKTLPEVSLKWQTAAAVTQHEFTHIGSLGLHAPITKKIKLGISVL